MFGDRSIESVLFARANERLCQSAKVFHRRGDLPPLMKQNHVCQSTATRKLQNLAHLQRVESQRLKTNANLHCTVAHKVQPHLGNVAARTFERSVAQINLYTALSQI